MIATRCPETEKSKSFPPPHAHTRWNRVRTTDADFCSVRQSILHLWVVTEDRDIAEGVLHFHRCCCEGVEEEPSVNTSCAFTALGGDPRGLGEVGSPAAWACRNASAELVT